MVLQARPLKREEILRLAVQARLMIEEGDTYCLNDLAADKELLVFARLLETRINQSLGGVLVGSE
ncbi:MAG TPA: hypothetical protein VEC35_00720 [Noviherbaspirillum sp.]|nr:hypothetical protein [Noviherbaspirillum sp.]